MNSENFNHNLRVLIQVAEEYSKKKQNLAIEPIHLLKAFFIQRPSFFIRFLEKFKVDEELISSKIEKIIDTTLTKDVFNDLQDNTKKVVAISPRTFKLISDAEFLAFQEFREKMISEEVLFISIALSETSAGMLLRQIANANEVEEFLKEFKSREEKASKGIAFLNKYSQNLTKKAKENQLDPVIGRTSEIQRALEILSRKRKNNPMLVGSAGVGKTALVEGLALRIAANDVPTRLQNTTLRALDLTALVAGTKFRGEFEERIKMFIETMKEVDEDIILFIDEIHMVMGAGGNQGGMDASNILKPYLARGEIRCIGATTLDEFQMYLEKDSAMTRRFQKITIEEPSRQDTLTILRGLKTSYETHHEVKIKDEALVAATDLAIKYISDRFLPDKAIDLVDEAAARLRMELDGTPLELDRATRNLEQYNLAKKALAGENPEYASKYLKDIEQEEKRVSSYREQLLKKLEKEKELVTTISTLELKADSNEEILRLRSELESLQEDSALFSNSVTKEAIAQVVSRWTGIPSTRLTKSESKAVLDLEANLKLKVKGQDAAIKAVSNAIKISKSGVKDPRKPIGSFLFLGPTGVGKTTVAKTIASQLFNGEKNMVRIDMSEYMEKHSVARLIGAPPGYVGYERGGQLSEAVRRRPYSVILFDEIEKAHPDVLNVLLQVLDDGRITDGQGKTVDFKNTLIIMTSNMGSSEVKEKRISMGPSVLAEEDNNVNNTLRRYLRPEFINRIDEIVRFNHLTLDLITEIVDNEIEELNLILEPKQIIVALDKKAKQLIAEKGFDPQYGARPLKRMIYKKIQLPLADLLLQGKVKEGDIVKITVKKGKLTFNA